MASSRTHKAVYGFIAGAIATLVFHQCMYAVLTAAGWLPQRPWRMTPVAPLSVPWIISLTFWGGLWGIPFALLYERLGAWLGGAGPWLRGMVFAAIGPLLLGSWLIVPILKGNAVFAGLAPQRMLIGILLNVVAYGIGLGISYVLLLGDQSPSKSRR
jgi:hypothetical protein